MIARPSPTANAPALTPSGAQIEPVANILHKVPTIWLGTVKNSFVPSFIGTKYGRNCHTRSSRTMLAVPSAAGWMRCHRLRAGAAASAGSNAATMNIDGLDLGHGLLPDAPGERGALRPPDAFGQDDGDGHDGEDAAEHAVDGEKSPKREIA